MSERKYCEYVDFASRECAFWSEFIVKGKEGSFHICTNHLGKTLKNLSKQFPNSTLTVVVK